MPNLAASERPTVRDPDRVAVAVFDLPGEQFAAFTADLRRLSRTFTFRWLLEGDEDLAQVQIRVEDPPAILVSRFAESGRVRFVSERDDDFIAEIDSIPLAARLAQANGATPDPIAVRIKLTSAEDHDSARLWILRDDALVNLTAYCRSTNELLLARFSVAISASTGVPCVVLRANTTKGPPPIFVGPAIAYKPALKLDSLFVPLGTRLAPPIRRDAIRTALGVATERIVWLHPTGNGSFAVESLAESAFRPLVEWIDYKLPEAPRSIQPWAQSVNWALESFVERAPAKAKPKPPVVAEVARPATRKPGLLSRAAGWFKGLSLKPPAEQPALVEPNIPVEEAVRTALNQGDRLHLARPETTNSALERCHALEAKFLRSLPELKADEWAELAGAYDSAGNHADAALCWLNALWGQSNLTALWAWGWLRAESRAAKPEVKTIDPEPWLKAPPGPGTTRAMAAWVVWASLQKPNPPALANRANELQARLEANEHWLPVRAAWLARAALARLGSGDVLSLARARDRLSDRLLATGLSLELDTPSFLRFAGDGVRERFQEARRWLTDKRDLIHQWLARLPEFASVRVPNTGALRRFGLEPNVAQTRAYVDLILAWGMTRFAENTAADAVRKQAHAGLPADDPVHAALRAGFEFRIAQVRDGKPPRGPLPDEVVRQIAALDGERRYAVDKLRESSRVLEPTAGVDAYHESVYRRAGSTVASAGSTISNLPAERLAEEAPRLLEREAGRSGRPDLAGVTAALLERAGDLTEPGIDAVAAILPMALEAARNSAPAMSGLIQHGLAAAALWDRPDLAKQLAMWVPHLAAGPTGWETTEGLIAPGTRHLRRLGLKAEADRILHHVAERVTQGQPIGRIRAMRPREWPVALRVLLHAAAGWYSSGRDEQAHAVLDEARKDLFARELPAAQQTALALAYAATLGQAPVRVALGRLEEMFQRLEGIWVGGSTNAYYCLKPLILVETAVRAIVSEEFTLGPQVRAWLDADEFAVRRRIRDELKAVLSGHEL